LPAVPPGPRGSRDAGAAQFVPLEFEPGRRCVTSIWRDPRTGEGELAWPGRFDREAVREWKHRLLAYGAAGQLQQRPAPAGGVFDRTHFRYFAEERLEGGVTAFALRDPGGASRRVLAGDCTFFQTVDTALKAGASSDYTVVLTAAVTPERDLLVADVFREKVEAPLQYGAVLSQRHKHPYVLYQAVEDKVSGVGLLQQGRLEGTPFRPLKADGDKVRRAAPLATMFQNDKVCFRAGAPWLGDLEDELTLFPRGAHDDQADCLAYAAILAVTDALLQQYSHYPGDLVWWPEVPRDEEGRAVEAAEDPPGVSVRTHGGGDVVSVRGLEIYFDDEDAW
jgi:predicted phage terminase large subunit-like protein